MDSVKLERRIGQGMDADVWLAQHDRLGTLVVKAWRAKTGRAHSGFLDERDILQRLRHENIVQILGFDIRTNQLWLEHVEGMDLDVALVIREAAIPYRIASAIILGLTRALEYAHGQDVLHRDICPANVLLGFDGALKLADFSIAKSALRRDWTTTGIVKGRVLYLAPELVNEPESEASDVYALGVLFWTTLLGHEPTHIDRLNPYVIMQMLGVDQKLAKLLASMTHPVPAHRTTLPVVEQTLHAHLGNYDTRAAIAEFVCGLESERGGLLDELVIGPDGAFD